MNSRLSSDEKKLFRETVWREGKRFERANLPWRYIDDAYAVYISEVMLQQTTVARVLRYWERWMKQFPTLDSVASASSSDILEAWQGLGYNRRALALKRACDICSSTYEGELPSSTDLLLSLPGIGPATAAGIRAFAYQLPGVYLETNVRAVFIHSFFEHEEGKVTDRQLIPLVEQTCSVEKPREWYYALLDYGAHLKATIPNPTRKASAYVRQSAFKGSWRQKRSFVIKEVLNSPGIPICEVERLLNSFEISQKRTALSGNEFNRLLEELSSEGFFSCIDGTLVP